MGNTKNAKKMHNLVCEKCDFKCSTRYGYNKHIETIKHKMVTNGNIKTPHLVCEKCDFKCSKQCDYDRHIETTKHKMVTNGNIKTLENEEINFTCICGNTYKYRPGLTRHKRTCIVLNSSESIKNDNNIIMDSSNKETNKVIITKHMFMELINDNKEMMKMIKEQQEQIKEQNEQLITMIPKLGNTTNNNTTNNTNNNFNLNLFLNEKCKDALNMSEFIDSLKITLEDLLFSKNNGISRGVTDVMIKGLKELDVYKRPIHCTDIKRDTMYIKDEDKWQKDDNHHKMKNTIVKIADKERTALQQWAVDNPDWIETEKKQIEYLTMVRSICEPIENFDKYERKIVKNVGKEIIVDKKL